MKPKWDKNIGIDYGKKDHGLNDASLCYIIEGLEEQDALYDTPTPINDTI